MSIEEYLSESDSEDEDEKKKKEEEKGPLDLQSLDISIIDRILEKMTYLNFALVEELSSFTASACQNLRTTVPNQIGTIFINEAKVKLTLSHCWENEDIVNCERIPWNVAIAGGAQIKAHILRIPHRITTARLKQATRLFKKNRTVIYDMILTERITFDPEALEDLLKTVGIGYIKSHQYLPKEFFTQRIFEHLSNVDLGSTGFTDEEFLALKWDGEFNCTNDFITARGLNKFLKQWRRKEREIGTISIQFDGSFNTRPFDIILEGLDANPIWTRALHKDSIIGMLKIEEYPPMESGDPFEFYSIWRPDDIRNSIQVIQLSMGEFQIWNADNEIDYVLDELTDDQFYLVMAKCRRCYRNPCRHRRDYSTNKFKLAFPLLWEGIMTAVRTAKWTTTVARYSQLLLEAPRIVRRLKKEKLFRYMLEENPQNNWVFRYWLLFELYQFMY